jgi:type VI secretion system protein ImpL
MTPLDGIVNFAAANQLLVLGVLAILVLIVAAAMAFAVVRARRAARFEPAAEAAGADLELVAIPVRENEVATAKAEAKISAKDFRRLMGEGLAAYRDAFSRNPYLVPWVLRIGVGGGGAEGVLASLDASRPPVGDAARDGVSWHIYDRGVVIDVASNDLWLDTLAFAARQRPAMPIDGIVLTVPVSALGDVRKAGARGAEAHARLWEAQRNLGFAVPVYVVLTGVEELDGFRAFEALLPDVQREGIIGWSFPYAIETAFTPEFVGEALQTVEDAILSTCLEAFGDVVEAERGAMLLRTREELAALEEPLRAFLTTALRRTAYQECLYFRGVYFTVQPDPEVPASFAHDLIERKVLAEHGLPKELRNAGRARLLRRYAWPAAIAAAAGVGAVTIGLSLARVEQYRSVAIPILRTTAADVEAILSRRTTGGRPGDADAYADAAVRYLRNVAALETSEPLVFMPLAWIGEDPYGVQAAMQAGWRKVALGGVKRLIEQRLDALAEPADAELGPELAFVRYLSRVAEAEGFARAFNDIGRRGADVPVREMLQYALQVPVARSTVAKLEAWKAIGPDAEPLDDPSLRIDTRRYRDQTLARFEQLADAYFRQMAAGGQIGARLSVVAVELGFLASGARSGADAATGFAEVLAGLEDATRLLSAGQPSWIGAEQPVIPASVQQLLDAAAMAELLGPGVRETAAGLARRRYDEVRGQVGTIGSVIGPLVLRQSDGSATLTAPADGLRQVLAQATGRRFMAPPTSPAVGRDAARGYAWDASALETIPPLFEDYLLFEAKELPQVPAALRPALRSAAQHGLRQSVERALAQASNPGSGAPVDRLASLAVLRDWSRSLRTAFPVLEQTIQTFMQLGMPQPADALRERVAGQAASLLRQADRIVEEDQLYRPSEAYLWSWGGGPIEPHAFFGQASPGALAQMLVSSRMEMASLAREIASPMIEVLSRPLMQSASAYALASRWLRVVAALDQYDGSRPNSPLAQLERFVTDELGKIDDKTCLSVQTAPVTAGDFFSDRLEEMKGEIRRRCVALADERLIAGYRELSSFFNERLAGLVPFNGGPTSASASPADVRAFYELMEARAADVLAPIGGAARTRPEWREAARFVEAMSAARPLLSLVANPPANAQLVVEPTLRANREREVGGSDIIEWRVALGQTVQTGSVGTKGKAPWAAGQAVGVELRWAKDGPVRPVEALGPAALGVEGLTARFGRSGPWALLAFLRDHEAPAADRAGEARGQLLVGLDVRTEAREAEDAPQAAGQSAPSASNINPPARPAAAPTPLVRPQAAEAKPVARVYLALDLRMVTEADGRRKEERLAFPRLPTAAPVSSGPTRPPRLVSMPGDAMPGRPAAIDRAIFDLADDPAAPNLPARPPAAGPTDDQRRPNVLR